MDQQQSSDTLAKWAAIFRDEGDTDTADAIERQLADAERRSLSEDDADWLKRVLAHARQLDGRGDYEAAAEGYGEALRVVEAALGTAHPQIIGHLNDVARCWLNAGFYETALAGYSRLLRLVQDLYGSDDELAETARYYVRSCQTSIRLTAATMNLQVHMNEMLRHSQGQLVVATGARADRMRAIALRLAGRGRLGAAIRLLDAAIALRLRHASPTDELALLEIHRYAMDLRDAGAPGRAAETLIRLVVERNRKSAGVGQATRIRNALTDMALCLSAQGQERSAQEVSALADLLARRNPGVGLEDAS